MGRGELEAEAQQTELLQMEEDEKQLKKLLNAKLGLLREMRASLPSRGFLRNVSTIDGFLVGAGVGFVFGILFLIFGMVP